MDGGVVQHPLCGSERGRERMEKIYVNGLRAIYGG